MDSRLNSQNYISQIDKNKMYDLIFDFPEQIESGIKIFHESEIELNFKGPIRNIVICGMGGSAIAGDILKDYSRDSLSVPISIIRESKLPKFIDKHTLLIAISYSGNTYETLDMLEEGISKGANVSGICSGGKMQGFLENLSKPVFIVPSGLPPRQALGFLFSVLLMIISKLFNQDIESELMKMALFLKEKRGFYILSNSIGNIPKSVAERMYSVYPFIYSDSRYFGSVVKRWKTQMNENAKHLVSFDLFPELTHNEIVGWEAPPDTQTLVLLLRDNKEEVNLREHINSTKRLFNADEIIEIRTEGETLLERMFYLIFLGDWTSFY
ncbi:MAG TPA: bifunctional phosphoglucose/phosphomannose isomerase, partial [Firmicutes bacterium]|nr:bifunctional phosphoglucose/phosphomannose isomerase [Bacillota bacterium]